VIFDHISIGVSDYQKSKAFYAQALAPLGIGLILEIAGWAGFGKDGRPQFWFGARADAQRPLHIAFVAENREQVRAFYAAAVEAGGKDNGGPGIRAIYHPNYYGAFVIDPDGNNVEAVCHKPEQ
jgi:catechol 2,3-dioxygenase-like lactoylglutathione lyase family enzyme